LNLFIFHLYNKKMLPSIITEKTRNDPIYARIMENRHIITKLKSSIQYNSTNHLSHHMYKKGDLLPINTAENDKKKI
jgi:hypothetical protein